MIDSFLNYTGSKTKLMEFILPYIPEDKDLIIDVFCGGGGFFINQPYDTRIIINDRIEPLINLYKYLRNHTWFEVSCKINANLDKELKTSQEKYLALRSSFNQTRHPFEFLMLVSACTNNMMRFNKSFEFNQTWGKRCWNEHSMQRLAAFHSKLGTLDIEFHTGCYTKLPIEELTTEKSLIYFDPPYMITEAGYNCYW